MKPTLRRRLAFPAFTLPFLLACLPPGDPPPQISSPGERTLAFRWDGQTSCVEGSYGASIEYSVSPSGSEGIRWHLEGPGTLLDIERKPVDLNNQFMPIYGWYVPPAQVPAGGITVQFSIEVKSPISHQWERSQNFPIRVDHKTTPMTYEVFVNHDGVQTPTSATLHPGETFSFAVHADPIPLDFRQQQRVELLPVQATSSPLGTAVLRLVDGGSLWAIDYTAPAALDVPRDITVRAIAHDPWVNQDPHVDFTVHLVP